VARKKKTPSIVDVISDWLEGEKDPRERERERGLQEGVKPCRACTKPCSVKPRDCPGLQERRTSRASRDPSSR
jgi:hypothetical protein